jgi:hypothetical protein
VAKSAVAPADPALEADPEADLGAAADPAADTNPDEVADDLPTTGCLICGREPTAAVELRANTGMVLTRRHSTIAGRFCRDCGLSLFRKQMNHTLLLGWWGIISFFTNFAAITKNVSGWLALRSLDPPVDDPANPPARPPLSPGKPLPARGGLYVALALVVAIGFIAVNAGGGGAEDFDKSCITIDRSANRVKKASCKSDHEGRVIKIVKVGEKCPPGTDGTLRLKADSDKQLCVDVDQ